MLFSRSEIIRILRVLTLKLNGYSVSLDAYISRGSLITKKNVIQSKVRLENVTLGPYTYISNDTKIRDCHIGKYCSIGKNIKIGLASHPVNYLSTSPYLYKKNFLGIKHEGSKDLDFDGEYKKTTIGHDVWIGDNVIICGGVSIGNGVIIAAGSIVTKSLMDYGVYGGIPARLIKKRAVYSSINENADQEWWELSESEIMEKTKKYEL
ncbi:CatB-related O-acetyltransferase [Vibrio cholerae]|nr:CatB-related O-acetyltransferase [Vibrio cholerae]EGR4421132.1 CatB-related O-acetyltransferase [Vibrio cholerae]EGR4432032.1 CatB-related O-acetyltransferase [Vibrio cholerae]HAS5578476.1 CatB-related O-acetyltransferase [Vibrio cholerae]